MPVLSTSAGMSSGSPSLLFFSYFTALLISSLVGWSDLRGRSTPAGCMSGGSSLFKSSSKCSAHLLSICSVPIMLFPSLSLTDRSGFNTYLLVS